MIKQDVASISKSGGDLSTRPEKCAVAGKDRSAWSPQSAHPLRSENLSRVPLPIIVYSRPKQTQTSDNTLTRGISSVATDSEASRNRSIPHHVCHEVRY